MDVKFYHNAPDRLYAACSIAAKAVRQGHRIVVFASDPGVTQQYDRMLWSVAPLSFVPHVSASSPLASCTPVILSHTLDDLPYDDVLINLAEDLPTGYDRFKLLVEIVGQDESGRQAARHRWRFYKENSHSVQAYDLAKL